jgi:hypothetical protein
MSCGDGHHSLTLSNPPASRQVTIGIAPKTSAVPYFNRVVRQDDQLVVTSLDSCGDCRGGFSVSIPSQQDLWIVEYVNDAVAVHAAEVARLGRHAFLLVDGGLSPLDIGIAPESVFSTRMVDTAQLLAGLVSQADSPPVPAPGSYGAIDVWGESELSRLVGEFSGAADTVIDGATVRIAERGSSANKERARRWLESRYQQLGFATKRHTYSGGISVIAELTGTVPGVIIVGSHLDSMNNAGADDNGAGTISALAIAQSMKANGFRHTLRVVAFDGEEAGLRGSTAYVAELKKTGDIANVKSMFNMEMSAFDSNNDGAFHVIHCNEGNSPALAQQVASAVTQLSLPLSIKSACTDGSDHGPFWNAGVPAIVMSENFFSGDANPCYHKSCDTVAKLNWKYMYNMTRAVAAGIAINDQQ